MKIVCTQKNVLLKWMGYFFIVGNVKLKCLKFEVHFFIWFVTVNMPLLYLDVNCLENQDKYSQSA